MAFIAGNYDNNRQSVALVAILFQGEIEDLDRLKSYLTNGVPVVVMDGCGGLGDIIGSAMSDRYMASTCPKKNTAIIFV